MFDPGVDVNLRAVVVPNFGDWKFTPDRQRRVRVGREPGRARLRGDELLLIDPEPDQGPPSFEPASAVPPSERTVQRLPPQSAVQMIAPFCGSQPHAEGLHSFA